MLKLILALVISYISSSIACSCFLPVGWQAQFYCRYNFAGTFRVLGPSYECGDYRICYPIVLVDQLRGPHVTSITVAETASESNLCGTTLTPGHTYFVSSEVSEGHIGVGLCMLLEDWTDYSCSELRKKRDEYKQIKCGDEPTEPTKPIKPIKPTKPECGRPSSRQNNILESILKLLKIIKLRSNGTCGCGRD